MTDDIFLQDEKIGIINLASAAVIQILTYRF